MLEKMTVRLNAQEMEALRNFAISEYRDFRSQAALIIRRELMRTGYLVRLPPGEVVDVNVAEAVSTSMEL